MPRPEQLEQVNRQLASHLEGIVDELRRTVLAKLKEANASAFERLGDIRADLPAHLVAPELLDDIAATLAPPPPAPIAVRSTSADLVAAIRRVDGAGTQTELLEGLLDGVRRFCDRSALFILAEQGVRGWAAAGFGSGLTALDDLSLAPGTALDRLAQAHGALPLDRDECTALIGAIDGEPAVDGALVPLVLRDRLAAALYVDCVADGHPIDLAAVQALGFVSAQALELLGLRERTATPTLYAADDEGAPSPLPLWSETGEESEHEAVAGAPAIETSWDAEPEPAEPEPVEAEPAIELPPVAIAEEPPAFVVQAPEAPAPSWGAEPPPATADDFLFSTPVEVEPSPFASPSAAPPAPEPIAAAPEPEAPAAFELPPIDAPTDTWETTNDDTAVASVTVAEAGESWSEPVFELAAEEQQVFELVNDEPAASEPAFELAPIDEIAGKVTPFATPEADALAEPRATGFERPIEETTAPLASQPFPWNSQASTQQVPVVAPPPVRADLSEDETVMIPRSSLPANAQSMSPFATGPTPSPVAPPVLGGWPAGDRTASGRGPAEVVPPTDLQGPGWAFSPARPSATSGSDEAFHEEARRLARLLVSEIKLYNEEQVEEGRRHKNIYARLKEDIDRSRQLYDERVHERVRSSTDYFQQELVRNLAGGDPSALGR
ncbi:MAG: hypothetical protein IPJ17_04220 [Holophagales bacterium]|nr:MAG: hypothetical protein IPJ17_04220 [Holophagales bacterium]